MCVCVGVYICIKTRTKPKNATMVHLWYPHRSHLFELLGLGLTDGRLEHMHLQLWQISCRDLQRELRVLAPLRQTWLHGWRVVKKCRVHMLFMRKPDSKFRVWPLRQAGRSDSSKHVSVKKRNRVQPYCGWNALMCGKTPPNMYRGGNMELYCHTVVSFIPETGNSGDSVITIAIIIIQSPSTQNRLIYQLFKITNSRTSTLLYIYLM